jgi:hypothetical protein
MHQLRSVKEFSGSKFSSLHPFLLFMKATNFRNSMGFSWPRVGMASQKRRRRRRGAVGTAEQEEVDVGEWEREAAAVSNEIEILGSRLPLPLCGLSPPPPAACSDDGRVQSTGEEPIPWVSACVRRSGHELNRENFPVERREF